MEPRVVMLYMAKPPRTAVRSLSKGRKAKPKRGMKRLVGAWRRLEGNPAALLGNTGVQGTPLADGPVLWPTGQPLKLARKPGLKVLSAPSGKTASPESGTEGSKLPMLPEGS